MGSRLKRKVLFASITILMLSFAILFALTWFQLETKKQKEKGEMTISAPRYLHDEEAVLIKPAVGTENLKSPASTIEKTPDLTIVLVEPVLFEYVSIEDSCGPYSVGDCVNMRSGPGLDYPVVLRLRAGMVLKVGGKVERDGKTWYKIVFDEWIRYPERVKGDHYISSEYVRMLYDRGTLDLSSRIATTTKHIIVDRSEQTLYAYEGDELFMQEPISTGIELSPTPTGKFAIFRKTPSRYMQGPLPGISNQYWDLPGVPWNLYFSYDGAVIHGAYWHNNFGKPSSHGCVNLLPAQAEKLYNWAELGMEVVVRD